MSLTSPLFLDFWDLNNDGMDWPSSENVVLYRNYLHSEFEKAMKDVDVEINYILVQVRQSYEETGRYVVCLTSAHLGGGVYIPCPQNEKCI